MVTTAKATLNVSQDALVNYLMSMARTVEGNVVRAIEALLERSEEQASQIFLLEPRINEWEIVIDEHALRLLRSPGLDDTAIRFVVASLKINNDLERMGDLAVNIGQRVISLSTMRDAPVPPELEPMAAAVRAMVSRGLGALIYRNVDLARVVLESDDAVDRYRDLVFERLLATMSENASLSAPNLHFLLASRHLERIADHATNIAEDILYWLRGLDVRHGRGRADAAGSAPPARQQTAPDPEPGVPDLP